MNPQFEQRLRKLEQEIITAQRRERSIQIRWIGKGERLRPGLRYVSDLIPVKENLSPEGDNNPPAAPPTCDSSSPNEGEKQEAGPEAALASPDLEAPDAQQPPTEWTLQAPSAKEPDVFVYRPEGRVNSIGASEIRVQRFIAPDACE